MPSIAKYLLGSVLMERKRNLHQDLTMASWLMKKVNTSSTYAQNLYAALCNNVFLFENSNEEWSCSWRTAGDIVAHMRYNESYLDWYCSGMVQQESWVEEGVITNEVKSDLEVLGWKVLKNTT
jgi:glucose-6-phosphate 1-dehydrogenase